jgi:amidase
MAERFWGPVFNGSMRRSVLLFLALAVAWPASREARAAETSARPFDPSEATIGDLQARMASGALTARQLTEAYLERIRRFDKAGPRLNAVIELNPDALEIADRLDAERRAGRIRGPLHGIPVLLKDVIGTADSMQTSAGSLALVGARPPRDAALVARLRDAGAVILGKTNLSEWANFRSATATGGWSARGGQTLNPYALDRDPSGSSSGSAVAVSASLCAFAIGTETDGSIMSPASVCGIVGLKPTIGLISRAGIIPVSVSQDTAGPMARTVRDEAIILGALSGADPEDPATRNRPASLPADFLAALKPRALAGARIGVVRSAFNLNHGMAAVLDLDVAALRAAGAVVVDPVDIATLDKIGDPERVVLTYEFRVGVRAWFAALGPAAPVHSLAQVIAFNRSHESLEMPFFGQEGFERIEASEPVTDKAYHEALALSRKLSRDDGIDAAMGRYRLDALVAITDGPAWVIDHVNGDNDPGGSSSLAAVAGYPSVTVPGGQVFGLPVGISFFGRAWSEALLLGLAADFEDHTHARRPPQFPPTASVP